MVCSKQECPSNDILQKPHLKGDQGCNMPSQLSQLSPAAAAATHDDSPPAAGASPPAAHDPDPDLDPDPDPDLDPDLDPDPNLEPKQRRQQPKP